MSLRILSLVAALGFLGGAESGAQDVIFLKNGQELKCQIEAITDNILTYQTSVDLGGGKTASAKRTISPSLVDYIEFAPVPGEREVLADPESVEMEKMKALWFEIARNLHRPRSNAGKVGLAFADALLKSGKEYDWNQALDIFDKIREADWNAENQGAAFQGRLRALIQIGDLETALYEAKQLTEESEDPAMLIEAKYTLALVDFESLKQLESENPKWEEDDTIRPDRNRLYHQIVDQFLWPYLFHGTHEETAARGLIAASKVYQFAGREEESLACLEDVNELYRNTRHAAEARQQAENLQQIDNDEKKPN